MRQAAERALKETIGLSQVGVLLSVHRNLAIAVGLVLPSEPLVGCPNRQFSCEWDQLPAEGLARPSAALPAPGGLFHQF